jgi:hypothetical protein
MKERAETAERNNLILCQENEQLKAELTRMETYWQDRVANIETHWQRIAANWQGIVDTLTNIQSPAIATTQSHSSI